RARPEWEDQIYDDLAWLGLAWETPVLRQSDRDTAYDAALDQLWRGRLLYPCHCNRRDIAAASAAPNEGEPLTGPDGLIYPGTCRGRLAGHDEDLPRPTDCHLRLDAAAAMATGIDRPGFDETGDGEGILRGRVEFTPESFIASVGDIILSRRDMGTSYHLSVVVDDAAQGITHVTRGADLFVATQIHVVLQRLLGLPTPVYHHHRLIRDDTGKRLAKRDDARAIRSYRSAGASPQDIRRMIGLA
ncbi:MAG: tRNA glutamyl-Q(34) synthetase GluQRS, partial [Rhodobacteraceae bacterium]|nr:tRNA glutamyl-Q(34) synthetase GluQRS [Paracoccaceae bacterium]